jgi:hypothetical protein
LFCFIFLRCLLIRKKKGKWRSCRRVFTLKMIVIAFVVCTTSRTYPHFVGALFLLLLFFTPRCLWCRTLTNDVFCLHFDLLHFTRASFLVRSCFSSFFFSSIRTCPFDSLVSNLVLLNEDKHGAQKSTGVHGNHLMCNGIVPVPFSLPLFSLFVYFIDVWPLISSDTRVHTHLSQPAPLPSKRIELPNSTRSWCTSFLFDFCAREKLSGKVCLLGQVLTQIDFFDSHTPPGVFGWVLFGRRRRRRTRGWWRREENLVEGGCLVFRGGVLGHGSTLGFNLEGRKRINRTTQFHLSWWKFIVFFLSFSPDNN